MDRLMPDRWAIRGVLAVLAIPQVAIGVWALVSQRGFYESFPGAGREWLGLYEGSYDQHLVIDVGSAFLAIGVILLLAAVWMDRRVVLAAAVAYIAYQLPHGVFHFAHDEVMTTGDQIANAIALALALLAAAAVVAWALRPPQQRGQSPSRPPFRRGRRLGPPPGGLVAGATRFYSRRRYGKELEPLEAFLHHKTLLFGYGAFESATLRAHRLDERLKLLAELKAAAAVGCEWCMDFGSKLAQGHGIPERQLHELPVYRESDAFDDTERLVIDYAAAISRTPSEADEALVERLRDRFDDAQIVELTNAIAIENFRARFNHALGLAPQGFSEGAACVVPELAERAVGLSSDRQPRSPDPL